MIRLILVIIFLLLYFILGLPILGVLWLSGRINLQQTLQACGSSNGHSK